MKNATAALLALLVLCSIPAIAVAAGETGTPPLDESETAKAVESTQSPAFLEVANTTNRLSLDGDGERAYLSPENDFSTAVAGADDELRLDHDRFSFEQRFDESEQSERETLIEENIALVDERTQELNDRERQAVLAHANGEISDRDLLRTLIRNYNEANDLVQFTAEIEERADTIPGYSVRDDAREMRNKLDTHRSPIRAHLDGANDGSIVVTVESGEEGFGLSVIDNQNYHHEVTRFDHRDLNGTDQLGSVSAANDHADVLYPWVSDNARGTSVHELDRHLYRLEVPHDQGDLDAFFDGATEQVTREHQTLSVGLLPVEPVDETWRNGDLEFTVNATPANGPAEVIVTHTTTGEPLDATVSIDGHEVGETDDGSLWIAPPTGSYELTVTSGTDTVNGTVSN